MFRRIRSPERIERLFNAHFDPLYRFAACRGGREAALDAVRQPRARI
jgi:hypothetical protein